MNDYLITRPESLIEKFQNEGVGVSVFIEGWDLVWEGQKSSLRITITGIGNSELFYTFNLIGERAKYGSNSLEQFHMVTSALKK